MTTSLRAREPRPKASSRDDAFGRPEVNAGLFLISITLE